MKIIQKPMEGALILEPKVFGDSRGFFLESYQKQRFNEIGITEDFVQDNHSRSTKNVLRGLHFTKEIPQSQILTVMQGKIFDVIVDVRKTSKTFGNWFGIELGDEGPRQIYMSHGFAHGFCVLSDFADLHYKVSHVYEPGDEGGLHWNDPTVNIDWPISDPIISERDKNHPLWDAIYKL